MTKQHFINRIVCEHWFCLGTWSKGRDWDEKKKQIWLSGMHRAWNILYPAGKIEPLGIVRKVTAWTKEEAEQWYTDYLSGELDEDSQEVDTRFDILDF